MCGNNSDINESNIYTIISYEYLKEKDILKDIHTDLSSQKKRESMEKINRKFLEKLKEKFIYIKQSIWSFIVRNKWWIVVILILIVIVINKS